MVEDKIIEEEDMEEEMEEDMEEDMEEEFQNSYWIANNAGKMVRQRVACGLEMVEGEVAVVNEPAFHNSYWKADEAGKLIMQRGARDLELFEGKFILDPQEEEEEEVEAHTMQNESMEEPAIPMDMDKQVEECPKSAMEDFGDTRDDEDRVPVTGETWMHYLLRQQRKKLQKAGKAEIDSEDASDSNRDPDYLPGEEDEEEEVKRQEEPRTRRSATKRHREVTGKRIECQVPGCKGLVTNIRRHIRLCHPDIEQNQTVKSKRVYERKECPKCGVVTTRLDLHLQRIHGVLKGEQLLAAVASGISRKADTPAMVALANCLSDYKKKLTSRRSSTGRSSGTVDTQVTAIRFFLPELCSDSVKRLDSVGDAGDVIDQELKKGTRLPGTLRLYLSSLVRFLEWVSGSGTWLRHLRMSSNEVVTVCRALISVKSTLQEDVNTNLVASEGLRILRLHSPPKKKVRWTPSL